MVIDSSAIIAILLREPEGDRLIDSIERSPIRLLSSLNALETSMVIEARKGELGGRELDLLLHRAQIEIVPLNAAQFDLARRAWRRFGKGNHPAALNLGDCCALALSQLSGEPLLFKGDDFARAGVACAT